MKILTHAVCWAIAVAVLTLSLQAEEVDKSDPQQTDQAQEAAKKAPTADDVIKQLESRQAIDPTERPAPLVPGRPAATAGREQALDPSVLGIAPGGKQPTLRREGEFVISRRGRVVQSGDGQPSLFAFEADAKDSPETPMILLPCQLLETMEMLAQQRGDTVQFIVSGQITAYRGANYLLPTMVNTSFESENLR